MVLRMRGENGIIMARIFPQHKNVNGFFLPIKEIRAHLKFVLIKIHNKNLSPIIIPPRSSLMDMHYFLLSLCICNIYKLCIFKTRIMRYMLLANCFFHSINFRLFSTAVLQLYLLIFNSSYYSIV